ncbi:MAG: ABC transporter ATP-binding protein [Candidatus Omnitrophota bacterium]
MNPAVKVENLGKKYIIRHNKEARYTALRDVITDKVRDIFSLNKPKIRSGLAVEQQESFWALKDISFEVNPGERLGIIGRNGAGKSTLLKLLSRITEPTTGRAVIRGRIASLLEVGTGFHPELTGRENIFLNGAVLGMPRAQIKDKFDAMVAFAEVEKFLDTPVKRYSSGMYVRLAFAVAAHLDPDILVVDEVLAVGDAQFQKKCLGKMEEVSTQEGRTVLFVSHNMGAIGQLCQKSILLENGSLASTGETGVVIQRYLEGKSSGILGERSGISFKEEIGKELQISSIKVTDNKGDTFVELDRMRPFRIAIEYSVRKYTEVASVDFVLETLTGVYICQCSDLDLALGKIIKREPGCYLAYVEFPGYMFNAGSYQVRAWILAGQHEVYDSPAKGVIFHLYDSGTFAATSSGMGGQRNGILAMPVQWNTSRIK